MKYEQILKRATALPLQATHNLRSPIITNGHKTIAEVVNQETSNLITAEESAANALLLTHSANVLPKAIEALKKAAKRIYGLEYHGCRTIGLTYEEANQHGISASKEFNDAIRQIENVEEA